MTAALEPAQAPQSTVLDIHTHDFTERTTLPPSFPTSPVIGLPFRASAHPSSTHAAISAYLTSFGFLSLLLYTGVNMRMLSSSALSTEAGGQTDVIVVFCCYSLCLMLSLLFFAYYIYRVMAGDMLRAKSVRDGDRVLLDAEWLHGQLAHRVQFERSEAVSVWSMVRSDQSVRIALTLLLALYCCLSLLRHATHLSTSDLLVLVSASGALMAVAALTDNFLACSTAFVLSDWLQPLLTTSLLGCPNLHTLSDGLLLATCQLLVCAIAVFAAFESTRPITALLFSSTFHCRLLLASHSYGTLLTFLACSLCSLTLHRMSSQQPQSTASLHAAADDNEDDADISEELWRARQIVCMTVVYTVASNSWRCVHCVLGAGAVQYVVFIAVLLLFGAREYKLRERHKQM